MQQHKRPNRIILGLLALGVLAGVALTANSAQAASGVGPYFPEPAWDRKLPAAFRFLVLTNWENEAVLDRETGLGGSARRIPCRSPGLEQRLPASTGPWSNRKGWRLPSAVELMSLIDPSVPFPPGPTLPPGHPFVGIQTVSLVSDGGWSKFPDERVYYGLQWRRGRRSQDRRLVGLVCAWWHDCRRLLKIGSVDHSIRTVECPGSIVKSLHRGDVDAAPQTTH